MKLYGKAVKTIGKTHHKHEFITREGFESFVKANNGYLSKYVDGTGGPLIPSSPMTWSIGNSIESIQYWKY